MRTIAASLLFVGLAVSAPIHAQTPVSALPISVPPGTTVQMELDGQDQDLLGMVKSLLAGAATPKTNAGAKAGAKPAAAPDSNPFLSFLGDGQLTALLKDIHHLHVVSFKPADGAAAPTGQPTDFLAFYEKPFEAEGGHRMLYLSGSTPVVTVGFDQPRGFAAVIQSSGTVTVVRADGYPDMTVIGSLLRTFGSSIPTAGLMGTIPIPVPATPPVHNAKPKATHAKTRRA